MLVFPYARTVVGDVIGALSSIPVLIAGNLLNRKKTWLVALMLIVMNGVLFAVTEVDVEWNSEWQGAVIGAVSLLITAELMGRVRESAPAEKVRRLEGPLSGGGEPRAADTSHCGGRICVDPQGQLAEIHRGEGEQVLDVLHQQAGEVASIVDDLLVATGLDSNELALSVDRVSVAREVASVIGVLTLPPDKKMEISIPGNVEAMADAGRLRQILRNLVSNPFRYDGPTVGIEASRVGRSVVLTIRDDGPGIPKDEWQSIFDLLLPSRAVPGQPDSVGLGLTVARQLAHRMDGDLTYRTAAGESCFILTLPAASVHGELQTVA